MIYSAQQKPTTGFRGLPLLIENFTWCSYPLAASVRVHGLAAGALLKGGAHSRRRTKASDIHRRAPAPHPVLCPVWCHADSPNQPQIFHGALSAGFSSFENIELRGHLRVATFSGEKEQSNFEIHLNANLVLTGVVSHQRGDR